MIPLDHLPRSRERTVYIFAFAVDGRIDLVRHAIVTLVPLEPDIVRGGYAPQRSTIDVCRAISTHASGCVTSPP